MEEYLTKAMEWAKANKPNASLQHKAAFANSVSYLCSGGSGGYGGPSIREHLCSWKLAGVGGSIETGDFNGNAITMIVPDGTLPRPGNWTFDDAIAFCDPLCFDPAENYRDILLQILERECCFDDDPKDLEALRGKS